MASFLNINLSSEAPDMIFFLHVKILFFCLKLKITGMVCNQSPGFVIAD